MDNRFNPYVCDGENSQACPDNEHWEFPLSATLDEVTTPRNVQLMPNSGVHHGMQQADFEYVPDSQGQSDIHESGSLLEMLRPQPKKSIKKVTKKVSQRGKAFSKEEDRIICYAFLNVSKDAVTGTNQSSGGYYQRMHDYFEEHLGAPSARSVKAIQHRWLAIQKAVNKFCGHYSTVDRLNESGKNEKIRIDDAAKLYEDTEPWTFEHCWHILRDEPKWNDKMLELNSGGTGTRVNQRVPVDGSAEPPPMIGAENADPTARPEGRDTTKKRKAKPCAADSVSSAAIEVLSAMNARGQVKDDKEDTQMAQILQRKDAKIELQQNMIAIQREDMDKRYEIEKEKLQLNREEVELRKEHTKVEMMKAEAHFMGQDLDRLAPHLRDY